MYPCIRLRVQPEGLIADNYGPAAAADYERYRLVPLGRDEILVKEQEGDGTL